MLKNLKTLNLPELELKVLEFWKKNQIFEKSLAKRKGRKRFVFYEGPPTANAAPAIHHLLARAFKDVIPRYKTMSGFYVPRQAGWDTHGLPVEIQVEKQLGFKSKKDIEKFGIAEFNRKCRESVWHFKEEWERFTERIGFWLDLKNPYITYEPKYIESLWWIIAQFFKRGFMYKGYRVAPWCPRCGTTLSSHELAQGYKEVEDDSVYVKFKLKKNSKFGDKTYVLSWTTTPWTLPGNVALAVKNEFKYVVLEVKVGAQKENWILAEEIYKKQPSFLSGFNPKTVKIVKGRELVGLKYEPIFNIKPLQNQKSHKVYDADFVTTEEGTGVVHTAVMYGEDDYSLGVKVGLPQHHTVSEDGKFTKEVPGVHGLYVKSKETEKKIFEHLKKNNNLVKTESYLHEYPHCWRCDTPLLYYARTSWFVAMSRLRKELLQENDKINWVPSHFKKGRFGEFLEEVKDWNFSRERYWGTPIPIWQCEGGHEKAVGSFEELNKYSFFNNRFIILRHGGATHNALELIAAGPEKKGHISRLTREGRVQVERLAKDLKQKKIDLIFSSPYRRTKETAAIVERVIHKKVLVDKRLRELDAGIFNWKPISEHKKFFKDPLEEFVKTPAGGENLHDVKRRMIDFILAINQKYEGKNILIVSHGDPLWMLEAATRGLSDEEAMGFNYVEIGEWREIPFNNFPFDEDGNVNPHRPYVDNVFLRCQVCRKKMIRTPEVADVWFDSGSMPFASIHYPFENKKLVDGGINYPADYIAEAVDQTRGWFYTLLAVATVLGRGTPYKNVVCLGLVNDKFGKKMSKSKGNIISPWDMAEKYGIDPVRWYLYTATPPDGPKNFDETEVGKTLRKIFLIAYNSYVFYETVQGKAASKSLHILDKWILARLAETSQAVTAKLDNYDIGGAGKLIEDFVQDLSRWYIRRSRKRPGMKKTLRQVLLELSKLMAPFTPFFAEALYQSVKGKEQSVHLEDWPRAKAVDKKLLAIMTEVRTIAAQALAKRSEAGIKVRQPLPTLKIKNSKLKLTPELKEVLMDEVNVKYIEFDTKIKDEVLLDTRITPELREEGMVREFTRLVQDLRQDAGLNPRDQIQLMVEAPKRLVSVLHKNQKLFAKTVGAKSVEFKRMSKFDAEVSTKIDSDSVWLALRKL